MGAGPRAGQQRFRLSFHSALALATTFGLSSRNCNSRHLIIVEPDIQNLDMSLYFVDYVALYQPFILSRRAALHCTDYSPDTR